MKKPSSSKNSRKATLNKRLVKKISPLLLAACATFFTNATVRADWIYEGGNNYRVNTNDPNPWTKRIGQGYNTPDDPVILFLTVDAGASVSTGNDTAITYKNNFNLTVNGTVQNASVNSQGGYAIYGAGGNTVEANNWNNITVNAGGQILSNGTQAQSEAINIMGFGNTVTNRGTIWAKNNAAIWFQDRVNGSGQDPQRNQVENFGLVGRDDETRSVIGTSGGNGIIFKNYGTVKGGLSFAQGNDDLYFYAGSVVTGSIDGGGGQNNMFLDGGTNSDDTLTQTLKNFQTITKTGEGKWTISGSISSSQGRVPIFDMFGWSRERWR